MLMCCLTQQILCTRMHSILSSQQTMCTRMQSALSLSEKRGSLIFTVPNPRVLLLLASSPWLAYAVCQALRGPGGCGLNMLKTIKNAQHLLLLADSLVELLLQLLISDIEARTANISTQKSLASFGRGRMDTQCVTLFIPQRDRKLAQTKQTSLSKNPVRKQGVCCV